ncbi:hypothetical protein EBZ39_05060 [bacterium]|nr:hypothetical protein [bacterium]
MSADIEKLAVLDSRIVQSRPKYAVEKGALSLTNAPFVAIAATSSQHTYNIYVPSENVFVDRKLQWTSRCFMSMTVTPAAPLAVGDAIAVPGRDFSLCAFPLNSLCSTLSATINDTTSVINSQDVLKEVLRLTMGKKNRLQRTCPTMLDKYQLYDDAYATVSNPIGGYDIATDYDNVPNGAWYNLVFTDPTGAPLPQTAGASVAVPGVAAYNQINGVPVENGTAAASYTLYFRWQTTEPLVLSPFVFADEHEWDTGLFGINNIQLIMNLQPSPARVIRSTSRAGRAISNVQYNTGVAGGQIFQNSRVNVQFLTPSLDVPLPPKSVVPYMEFPRYITTGSSTIAAGAVGQIQSQTITLPQIPDLLIIYVKPAGGYNQPGVVPPVVDNTQADWYLPVATSLDNVINPLSINFDNFSGLLSSHTAEELYGMSVKNGLEMDFNTWAGNFHTASGGYGAPPVLQQQGANTPAVGGFLVLKPSQDITLQSGQAPSLVGNFTLQFNLTVKNPYAYDVTPQLFVITANSGFFESIRGSSRIIKGVLSEQDIIGAPVAPMVVRSALERMVGGLSFGSLSRKGRVRSH